TDGAPLWFQVISLRTLEENEIATIPHRLRNSSEWIKYWLGFGPCMGPQVLIFWRKLRPKGGHRINNSNRQLLAQDVVPLWSIRLEDVIKYCEPPQHQKQHQAPIPTVIIDDAEEDADMTMPIKSHLKRMKFIGHGPMGAKRRKLEMLALAQKELPHQEELPEMKSTSSEISKSASFSSQHDEEVMDAFWDTLPRVDDTTGSTAAGLAPEGKQEEREQQ
ncbi:hypothetical protein Dimus_003717, partial [Dionaea muscipula]